MKFTYDLSALERSEEKWRHSGGIRAVYESCFDAMIAASRSGTALEVGAGIGRLKRRLPHLVTTDIVRTPYVDEALSAYELAGDPRRWDTIFAFDVLHHLCEPFRFLQSAADALQPGGRIILIEPAATPLGRWVYRLCHREPIRPARIQSPYHFSADQNTGEFANMGMAWALFHRDRETCDRRLKSLGLRIVRIRFRDGLSYLATGGLSQPQFLPTSVIARLNLLENRLPQALLAIFGLRMLVVLEKDITL